MIEAIYAVLEEWNRGNNDTMLDLDLDVDLIVRAIKDGSIFDNVAQQLLHDRRNNHLTLTDSSLTTEMVYGVVDDIHSK